MLVSAELAVIGFRVVIRFFEEVLALKLAADENCLLNRVVHDGISAVGALENSAFVGVPILQCPVGADEADFRPTLARVLLAVDESDLGVSGNGCVVGLPIRQGDSDVSGVLVGEVDLDFAVSLVRPLLTRFQGLLDPTESEHDFVLGDVEVGIAAEQDRTRKFWQCHDLSFGFCTERVPQANQHVFI